MGVFKEITKADGSGVTVFYRTNLASTFDISDLDIDTESVLYRTGKEISEMTEDKPYIVLCTEDYIYTDQYGSLISVERGTVYEMEHGTVVDAISIGGGGGGGGIPRSNLSTANSPLEQNVSIKASVNLSIHFVTTALKKTGTIKLYVNNVLKSTKTVNSGDDCEFEVSKYLKLGSNYFTIRTADDNGAEKNFDFLVNAVQLILSSGFNGSIPIPNTFDYIYRIKGAGEKTVHFILDGVDTTTTTTASDVDLTQKFSNLGHGAHSLVVYAEAELEGEIMYSNELSYSLLTYNPSSTEVIMLSNFDTETAMEGEQLKIDYLVYNPSSLIANVSMYINNEWIMDTTADRTQHYWTVSNYPSGTVTFKIVCGNAYIEKTVEVEPISIDIQEATEGLELKLTAANRSNQELEPGRSTWHYNDIYCQMNNFNWQSNGWMDGKLRLNGKANVVIPFQPFATDLRRTGETIELEFITYDAFSGTSRLISCIDNAGIGFDVTLDKSILASEQESVSTQFGEGARIRISFVVESSSANRLIKTYINGVLSGLKQYAVDDNFQQTNPTNIVINPDEEEIDITSIRIYNRALNSKEIVNNWIYDMTDISEKINAYNKNQIYDYYGNISYAKVKNFLPVVIVTGPMPTYKGDKKKVKVTYEHNLRTNYNFEQENCTIDVQGTSSQYYPRKNWKIKLVSKVQVDDGWLEEKTYCMKADFMESSHTYNIGTATLVNDIYDPNHYYPTRTIDNGVRDTMNGFPCVLFTKESEEADMQFAGTFMFNNDKADTDTLGYTIDPQYKDTSESWEFRNNTSDHCLFKSADFSPEAGPLDNFEARYPDEYEDFTALSRVFEWVVSCKNNPTKFKQEFDQYFNLHYCLIYQVMMETAIMVDSRAKNMFLDTADGIIWYPRFYDMDTCWGLNNEGVPAWSYDVEIHDRIGSAYVWDDRGASEFWNLFEEAYASEIKQMYHTLRAEKLTYENILHYYVENISNQFSASEYNEDSEFKYVAPLIDEGNATYLYAAQGNRQDYFRWMVKKRLKYLDSKYQYGDYNNNYATMRWYTKSGNLTITTYQTMYIKVRFGSVDVIQRVERNTPTIIPAPQGLEFNDTEVIIWGADQIISFGDLTDKYAGTVDISNCAKLQTLQLCDSNHTNTNLVSLSLGNNPLLREINITNCSNMSGNLNLSGCSDLRIFKAKGTRLTGFILPVGPKIEELYLPATITSLTFKGMKNLEIFEAENYNSIQSLIYEDSSFELENLLCKCSKLNRMRIKFSDEVENNLDIDGFMYYYNNMLGIDEHGYNLPHPYFEGPVNIQIQEYHTQEEIDTYKQIISTEYANVLRVTYQNINNIFSSVSYLYPSQYYLTQLLVYDGDGYFHYETCPANTYHRYDYTNVLPSNAVSAHLEIRSDVTGIIYIPTSVNGINVDTIHIPGIEIKAIIIPGSYRGFNIDYFIQYQIRQSNSPSGVSRPSWQFDSTTDKGQFIWWTSNLGMDVREQSSAKASKLESVNYPGQPQILYKFYGGYLSNYFDTSKVEILLNSSRYSAVYDYIVGTLVEPNKAPFLPLAFPKLSSKTSGTIFHRPWYYSLSDHEITVYGYGNNNYGYMYYGWNESTEGHGKLDYDFSRIKLNTSQDSIVSGNFYANNVKLPAGGVSLLQLARSGATIYGEIEGNLVNMGVNNSNMSLSINPSIYNQDNMLDLSLWTQFDCAGCGINSYTNTDAYVYCPNITSFVLQKSSEANWELMGIPSSRVLKVMPPSYDYTAYYLPQFNLSNEIDCSDLTNLRASSSTNYAYRVAGIHNNGINTGNYSNIGKSFTAANVVDMSSDLFTNRNTTSSLPDRINYVRRFFRDSLYDVTLNNITCTVRLYRTFFDELTAEDIAIAVNKGWTVVRI